MTRVAIVGAGPAGLFAAHELIQDGLEVAVIDMGKDVSSRSRTDPFDLLHGMGGSGTFSDGKINFHPEVGGDLYEFLPRDEAWALVAHIEEILDGYGVEVISTDDDRTLDLEKRAAKCGFRFLPIRQAHIGSDHLTALMERFYADLCEAGVRFRFNTRVTDIVSSDRRAEGLQLEDGSTIPADYVLLAPGRVGNPWMQELARRHGLEVSRGYHRGVLLPQVAVRHGWSRERFLEETCRKAGLPGDAWRDPETRIAVFTAEVFSERDLGGEDG